MTLKTHYFIAVTLPETTSIFFKNWREENKDKYSFRNWVHHEDLHITLAFLGHPDSNEQIDRLKEELESKLEEIKSFQLNLQGLGTFGNSESPRIFWAGVKQSFALTELRNWVYECCENVGFELDKKPFRPHITLARKWAEKTQFKMTSELEEAFKEESFIVPVTAVHLVRTHLDRVPKYESVYIKSLK
ncbi:RNA 2',3'-cyclic phosphodiesterase [Metabacillus herbersteinensis]|uniref:RNA 2',3'-cyclic phosphodiesterase n=1 Tax=Metabacillus herbersteinensis TaxID=283816 RepID=A0ABV6G9Z3_9BACI